MRRLVMAGLMVVGLAGAKPACAGAWSELGYALGATTGNIVYLPAKVAVAVGGMVVGSLVGMATGGDVRAAYSIWVPAASGTYLLTPGHFDGSRPIEFFGTDYGDRETAREAGSYEVMSAR